MEELLTLYHHLKLILIGTENFTFLLHTFTITRTTTVEANIQNKILILSCNNISFIFQWKITTVCDIVKKEKKIEENTCLVFLHVFHSYSISSL